MKFNFIKEGFKTERSYDNDYAVVPQKSGVYLIVDRKIINNKLKFDILYIGSSRNLKSRLSKHEVYRTLVHFYNDVIIYFKEEENHLIMEKSLIKMIQPEFNTQWL